MINATVAVIALVYLIFVIILGYKDLNRSELDGYLEWLLEDYYKKKARGDIDERSEEEYREEIEDIVREKKRLRVDKVNNKSIKLQVKKHMKDINQNKMKHLITSALVIIALGSCTDSQVSKVSSLGSKHKIELYNGGQLVKSWISTGKPISESSSDGYYFTDSDSGKLVEVSGTLIITQL